MPTPEYQKKAAKKYYEKNKETIGKKRAELRKQKNEFTTVSIPITLRNLLKKLALANGTSIHKFIAYAIKTYALKDKIDNSGV